MVANSICYQLMLQPNSSDLITIKLIDAINNATKVCNTHTHMHMHMHAHIHTLLVASSSYIGT